MRKAESKLMARPKAKYTQASSVRDTGNTAIAPYVMPDKPSLSVNTDGLDVQNVGDSWVNKKGETKGRKSLVIKVPSKPLGLTGEAATNKATELGKAIKPAVMGRVASFAAHDATIVRRYSETPGKRKRVSVMLEQVVVESSVDKLAREYADHFPDLTLEQVKLEIRKRLNIPESPVTVVA